MWNLIKKGSAWLVEEAKEKLDIRATWHELKLLGQKYGRRFFIVALLWEMVEDILFPFLAWKAGVPALMPVFLVLHFEPIVYPIFFFLFKTWDRIQGKEPWEPDRNAQSTYWRAGLQTLTYRIPALVMFYILLYHLNITLGVLTVYTVVMSGFGFIHDRIWHDSNYGINVDADTVEPRRVFAKVLTYRIVSTLVMGMVFMGLNGEIPMQMGLYQGVMFVLQTLLGLWWSRSSIGIRPVIHNPV